MRLNEPITDREILVPETEVLVSGTDAGGRILFANPAFVEVSGFAAAELEGAPHNLVRHPHMPQAAFHDLWATLKAGRPWEGLVKNRTKGGDFYWVRANVTPLVESGQTTGYISIRTRPDRAEIAAAEAAYAALRQGSRRLRLRDGELVPTGWRHRLAGLARSITGRLGAAGAVAALSLGLVGWLGLSGMTAMEARLRQVQEERIQPAARLAELRELSREAVLQVSLMPGELLGQTGVAPRIAAVRHQLAQIDAAWPEIAAPLRGGEEAALAGELDAARRRLVAEGIEPALALAERQDGPGLRAHLQARVAPLAESVSALGLRLGALQADGVAAAQAAARAELAWRLWLVPMVGLAGLALLAAIGLLGLRSLRRHLGAVEATLQRLSRGELRGRIASPAASEFRRVTSLLRALRARLSYAEQEHGELDRRAAEARCGAMREMAGKVEAEAQAAVDAVAGRSGRMAAQAAEVAEAAGRLGEHAEASARASGRALENTQAVAAATEELAASIREITTQTAHAREVVEEAVRGGRAAETTILSLAEAAGRVNEVVRLIGDVAARTNLLALNATIEAARAGDAGKGFAVVAGEVKQLAAQTARATEDISRQLNGIATATDAAVHAVAGMGRAIGRISESAGVIAAAVEQQGVATQEIARNVAANGEEVREMAGRIDAVARDALAAGARAAELRDGTDEVDRGLHALRASLNDVVRSSMDEADRRLEPRFPVREPCLIEAGTVQTEAKLLNLSAHGALVTGAQAVPPGTRGVLTLPRH
ncbi:methyl-accepting chemotaxis protein [Roseicella frigidaeris]|uniref:Chemotaxis protein n=1 Tax=Roseicella frigidaeris TaxID=2230885 RepID=A0A327M811_9PROT|nr:methyl-accepting chemotaxis protein [Roseicella frigidaeris]RAI58516.1 chemotaxis protein [Roseicella frigidaeris]